MRTEILKIRLSILKRVSLGSRCRLQLVISPILTIRLAPSLQACGCAREISAGPIGGYYLADAAAGGSRVA
jgi:hypothetical protein